MATNLYAEQVAIIARLSSQVLGVNRVVGAQYYARTRELGADLPVLAVLPGTVELQSRLDGKMAVTAQEYVIVAMLPYGADDGLSAVALEAAGANLINQCVSALEGWQPLPNVGGQVLVINQPAFADGYAEFSLLVRYTAFTY